MLSQLRTSKSRPQIDPSLQICEQNYCHRYGLIQAQTNHPTRQQAAVSFIEPLANKDCYKFSFSPRTFAKWNKLPPETRQAASIGMFKSKLQSLNMDDIIRGGVSCIEHP